MPRSNQKGPSNNLTGLGVTRAHSEPFGVAPEPEVVAAALGGAVVEQPSPSAPKARWVEYATLLFGYDVTNYTKSEIREMVEKAAD